MTLYEQKFRDILAEILQLDQAELDFGIYRIMNQKRKDIEAFLNNRLVPEVTNVIKSHAAEGADVAAMENEVFSHLAKFFGRYYEGGDFISKRRYKDDAYAIPYSGEEVKLYWANADQYYIKTSEYFKNYAFHLPTSRRKVHFVLRDAETEQNNNKAANNMERRFQLCEEDFIAEEDGELNIYFTYELMPKATKQDALIKDAEATLSPVIAERFLDYVELVNVKAPTERNKERTLLMKHLQDYTAKNNFDYFIHKDLGGFLRRELDFYIKNEVMFLDDLDANHILEHLAQVKAIKQVGEKIIAFLAQLEDFQKKLWLKKKFVVGCDYCITLDRIPHALYPEIIANDVQRKEWVKLFAIDEIKGDMMTEGYSEPLTEKFLEENPFLVLDTKFFSAEFKHKLVGSMENVDEECNGLLINSENFQALELLQEKYKNKIGAIITDPPYNTGGDDFLYKDNYANSSWLSLMDERLKQSKNLLRANAWISININDIELYNLVELLETQEWGNINQVCVKMSHLSGMKMSHIDKKIPKIKEQIVTASKGEDISLNPIYEPCEWDDVFSRYTSWMEFHNSDNPDDWTKTTVRAKAKELGVDVNDKECFDSFRIENASSIFRTAVDDAVANTPKDGKVRMITTAQGLQKYILNGEDVLFASSYMKNVDGKLKPVQPKGDIWTDIGINNVHNEGGVQLPNGKKPVKLFERLINMLSNEGDYILDMFAGSGTITHACLNSDKSHKYIAIQSDYSYFTEKTLRRTENVIYSDEWKLDKPVSRKGISQCFKYIRLEQYEDTLNNLQPKHNRLNFSDEDGKGDFAESYLLGYMLDTETKGDLFNLEWFVHPFNMTLKTTKDNELVDTPVDMVETFNYLIGLNVETLRYPKDGYCVVEGYTHIGNEHTLVIWRDCEKVSNEALNEFFRKQAYSTTDSEFDKIYVNGDNTLPNIKTDEEHWKVVLIEEEFKKECLIIMAKKVQKKGKLQQALVLFHYILNLFGCKDLEALSRDLKDPMYEGVNEDGESKLYHELCHKLYATGPLSKERLYYYDEHIVKYTNEINEKRSEPIKWKYFQYLSLLFTEIYLDQYFSDAQALCDNLNFFLHNDFNHRAETWHELPDFTVADLNKLAYWNATGSGKTLLMHINIKQYLYYAEHHHAKKINRIIVLTPKEGLSRQHLDEFAVSNMQAELFSKQSGSMFRGQMIEVIDINKLSKTDGDKTVAVESFEGNNLVLVDEGHRGTSGESWLDYRKSLTEEGFSFEYSATFGQAISAKSNAKERKAMFEQYGKATLFDYSYRYFYADGYGKDYRIMNMDDWNNDELLNMYLTAYLLCLYEQIKIYGSEPRIHNLFHVEKPLGIFVGSSVKAVSKENKNNVSDVTQILLFLQAFIDNKDKSFTSYIRRLLSSEDGLKTKNGYSVFGSSFQELKHGYLVEEDKQKFADNIYVGILQELFHSSITGAKLHIDLQKGGFEEIGLRVGNAPYFGVINVGDGKDLVKLLQDKGFLCETKAFGTSSLFATINSQDSSINILIGSKKFTEGWSSWRVSAMGLMSVGRSEGSEIIQLFGRGVRLKGYKYSLKRSKMLDACYQDENIPKGLSTIETLNIFGVRADYMEAFKAYLEDEGLPTNEMDYEKITINTIQNFDLQSKGLMVPRVMDGYNFKKSLVVEPADDALMDRVNVKLNRYPKVDLLRSKNVETSIGAAIHIDHLRQEHLDLIDWTEVYFALQRQKNERGWYNMEIKMEDLTFLMAHPSWYELAIPEADLTFTSYGKNVAMWQDITICLLRGYIDQAYKKAKARAEQKHLRETTITEYNLAYTHQYEVEVRNDQVGVIENLRFLQSLLEQGTFSQDVKLCQNWFEAIGFDNHFYKPLLYLAERDSNRKPLFVDDTTGEKWLKVSPVALNEGERNFVKKMCEYYEAHKDDVFANKELYLLRNESKKGMGFFEANNFYPDFILWILDGEKQYLTFIDPKGIRNLKGMNDPKIQLFKYLQTEVAEQIANPNLIMTSFIVSNTPMEQVEFWSQEHIARGEFAENHVLFETDANYVEVMVGKIMNAS